MWNFGTIQGIKLNAIPQQMQGPSRTAIIIQHAQLQTIQP
jgi:hypothetical protein